MGCSGRLGFSVILYPINQITLVTFTPVFQNLQKSLAIGCWMPRKMKTGLINVQWSVLIRSRCMSDSLLQGTNDSTVKWRWQCHFRGINMLAALNSGEIYMNSYINHHVWWTFCRTSYIFISRWLCIANLYRITFPSPTLVISKAAAETDQVIALSQDLMKHKTPKVYQGLIPTAFQTSHLSVQGEKGSVGSDCREKRIVQKLLCGKPPVIYSRIASIII